MYFPSCSRTKSLPSPLRTKSAIRGLCHITLIIRQSLKKNSEPLEFFIRRSFTGELCMKCLNISTDNGTMRHLWWQLKESLYKNTKVLFVLFPPKFCISIVFNLSGWSKEFSHRFFFHNLSSFKRFKFAQVTNKVLL